MMRKALPSAVLGVLCALAIFTVLDLLSDNTSVAASTWTPYTATMVIEHYDGGNVLRMTTVALVARRSDGSFVEFRRLVRNTPDNKRMIVDLSAGTRVSVVPEMNAKTSYRLPPEEIARLGNIPQCGEGDERSEVAGFEAIKVVRTFEGRHDPTGKKLIAEEWRAPQLNCEAVLAEKRSVLPDGTMRARNVEKLTSIVIGEPDPELFRIPSEYIEKAPSQVLEEDRRKRGRESCEESERTDQVLDDVYYQAQTAR